MKSENETSALNENILRLEYRQEQDLQLLRAQFHLTCESLKPINLIRNTLQEVEASPDIKNGLLNNVIGLATGYLSKKMLLGKSHNPVKNILGALVQFAVANLVAKHADSITSTAGNLLQRIFKKRETEVQPGFSENGKSHSVTEHSL